MDGSYRDNKSGDSILRSLKGEEWRIHVLYRKQELLKIC